MKMPYAIDLSDAKWTLLEPYLPTSKSTGRPRMHCPREMLNAIFYELLLKAACDRLPRLSHLWVDAGYEGRVVSLTPGFRRLCGPRKSPLVRSTRRAYPPLVSRETV
jgi:Putative transposase of IS4/5 family (DUF4096)